MRVVLDTNILMSALLWRGAPYRCLLAVQAGLADLVISPPILEELRTVRVTKCWHAGPDADEAIGMIRAAAGESARRGRPAVALLHDLPVPVRGSACQRPSYSWYFWARLPEGCNPTTAHGAVLILSEKHAIFSDKKQDMN
jgi:hypothetical protein